MEINEENAFEKLLSILVGHGYSEDEGAQLIADVIDEQYELDKIRDELSSMYQEAKQIVEENEPKYIA